MDLQRIDLDTIQPNGKRGETQRPAFTKINQNFQDVALALEGIPGAIADSVSGKNRLINGNFELWQRGDNFTAAAAYCADRFFAQQGGMDGAVIFKSPVAPGDSNFPRSLFTLAANCNGNHNAAGHHFLFEQRVESVRTFAASESTLSFLVYNAGTAGRKIAVEFLQRFGTGGSPTVTAIQPEVFTLAQGLNRISKTVSLPSIYGKTLGSGDDSVICAVWLSAGSDFNARTGGLGAQAGQLYFGEMQWEAGHGRPASSGDHRPTSLRCASATTRSPFLLQRFPTAGAAPPSIGTPWPSTVVPAGLLQSSKARCAARQSCCSMQAEKVVTSDRRASGGTTTPRAEHGARER